jgi:hypothetical protein
MLDFKIGLLLLLLSETLRERQAQGNAAQQQPSLQNHRIVQTLKTVQPTIAEVIWEDRSTCPLSLGSLILPEKAF